MKAEAPIQIHAAVHFKASVRKVVPRGIYRQGSRLWEEMRRSARSLGIAARWGVPDSLLHFGVAPGDDLLCTAVLRELRKRGSNKLWMMSNHPDFFKGNKDVHRVVPLDSFYKSYVKRCKGEYRYLEYAAYDRKTDRSRPPTRHVIAELCLRAGISGEVALRPYVFLTDEELRECSWATTKIVIQSSGLAARHPMKNKEWFPERFQEVVNQLQDQFNFVQLGAISDPLLQGTNDLRGKTTKRQAAAILSNCCLYVGNVGFLMHLARAVDCPSVIVFGGREAPWQSGYSSNANLFSPEPCAPCWLWNTCDSDRACMSSINPEKVVEAVRRQLARPRANLPVDTAVI